VPNNIPKVVDEEESRMMHQTIDNTPAYTQALVEYPEHQVEESAALESVENSLDDSKRDILLMDQSLAEYWPSCIARDELPPNFEAIKEPLEMDDFYGQVEEMKSFMTYVIKIALI
jgi:hypothetical protein